MTRGVYRIFDPENGAHVVHVQYDSLSEMDISEQRYRQRGYKPVFDALPWKEDHEAATAIMATKASNDTSSPQQA